MKDHLTPFLARWKNAGGTERAAEEARGHIRWRRPKYQNPAAVTPLPSPLPQGEREQIEAVLSAVAAIQSILEVLEELGMVVNHRQLQSGPLA